MRKKRRRKRRRWKRSWIRSRRAKQNVKIFKDSLDNERRSSGQCILQQEQRQLH